VPTYQYHCTDCGTDLEVFQHMTDPALTVCPDCQGKLRKIFSAVGVVFKGSGFYATDNRSSRSSAKALDKPSAADSSSGPSETRGDSAKAKPTTDKPSDKPAGKPAATPKPSAKASSLTT